MARCNADFIAHTATGRKKEWDVTIPAKGIGRVTLKKTGIIDYYCRFHPNMAGASQSLIDRRHERASR